MTALVGETLDMNEKKSGLIKQSVTMDWKMPHLAYKNFRRK